MKKHKALLTSRPIIIMYLLSGIITKIRAGLSIYLYSLGYSV